MSRSDSIRLISENVRVPCVNYKVSQSTISPSSSLCGAYKVVFLKNYYYLLKRAGMVACTNPPKVMDVKYVVSDVSKRHFDLCRGTFTREKLGMRCGVANESYKALIFRSKVSLKKRI